MESNEGVKLGAYSSDKDKEPSSSWTDVTPVWREICWPIPVGEDVIILFCDDKGGFVFP